MSKERIEITFEVDVPYTDTESTINTLILQMRELVSINIRHPLDDVNRRWNNELIERMKANLDNLKIKVVEELQWV